MGLLSLVGGGAWGREGTECEAGLGEVHSALVSKEGSRREVVKDLIRHTQCFQFDPEGHGSL